MPFKSNSLSDTDIKDILKSQGIRIKGVYMKDQLPTKLKTGFYVINLQSSFVGNGTHWTTFYYSPKHSYYFDAFGMIPPERIHYMIHPYTYNDKQIQNIKSTACGYYCIAFIIFMNGRKNKKIGFNIFIDEFSTNTKNNDKLLYNYLYN